MRSLIPPPVADAVFCFSSHSSILLMKSSVNFTTDASTLFATAKREQNQVNKPLIILQYRWIIRPCLSTFPTPKTTFLSALSDRHRVRESLMVSVMDVACGPGVKLHSRSERSLRHQVYWPSQQDSTIMYAFSVER